MSNRGFFWIIYFLSLMVALTWAFQSWAGPPICDWNPPAKFDREPGFEFQVIKMNRHGLRARCDGLMTRLGLPKMPISNVYYGCADVHNRIIFILKGGDGCLSEADIIRHERGHLNGWMHLAYGD